jgi:hypothetical protein
LEDAIVSAFVSTFPLLHYAGSTKACWRRPHAGGARAACDRGFASKAGFLAAAGLLDYALQLGLPVILARQLTTQEFGDHRLVWLVVETGLILFPLFLPRSLFYFLPRAAPGTRPKLVGNTFASLFALGGLAILLLLGLMPREAVAAQELYETI